MLMPFFRQFPIMVIMSVRLRLNLETSETIRVSPFFIFEMVRPSLLPLWDFLPLTTSIIHWSILRLFSCAYLLISSCWFFSSCLLVLTLKYPIVMISIVWF